MTVIHWEYKIYGISLDRRHYVQRPLEYVTFPDTPTPDSLNAGIEWFADFLPRHPDLPDYTYYIFEEARDDINVAPPDAIAYLNIMDGERLHLQLAIYSICMAITLDDIARFEQALYEQLKYKNP